MTRFNFNTYERESVIRANSPPRHRQQDPLITKLLSRTQQNKPKEVAL